MKRLFFALIFLFCILPGFAKNVFIDVLSAYHPKKIQIDFPKGIYSLNLDNQELIKLDKKDILVLNIIGSKVSVSRNGISAGIFKEVVLSSLDSLSHLRLQILSPKVKTLIYQDQLFVRSNKTSLQIINEVELNHYVSGVIESEIGNVKNSELLKVQAVISRTYALKHLERHASSGAQLCDQVHCQVYHGKSRFNNMIEPAVDSTGYEVIVDENSELIEAVFHANCGGETMNSEDIWSKPRSYLKSVIDTFCITEKQATWTKELSKEEWLRYLSKKSGTSIQDPCVFTFDRRMMTLPCCSVSFKDMRTDLKLRSTYFEVDETPDKILLKGKGFGHGVGMCQEGSIRMARLGISYKEIIKFYYCDISIVNLTDIQ